MAGAGATHRAREGGAIPPRTRRRDGWRFFSNSEPEKPLDFAIARSGKAGSGARSRKTCFHVVPLPRDLGTRC